MHAGIAFICIYILLLCVCCSISRDLWIYIHIQTKKFRSQTIETTTTYQNQNTIIYKIWFKHFFKIKTVHHIFPPLHSTQSPWAAGAAIRKVALRRSTSARTSQKHRGKWLGSAKCPYFLFEFMWIYCECSMFSFQHQVGKVRLTQHARGWTWQGGDFCGPKLNCLGKIEMLSRKPPDLWEKFKDSKNIPHVM